MMPRNAKYDVLFEPLTIGPKTMKNRFYQAPHCTGFGDVMPGAQSHHRAMKAEGGWAVVNTEATSIAPDWEWAGEMTQSRFWDDSDLPNWRLLTERAHEHDALVGIELHAGASFVTGFDSRMPGRHLHNRLEDGAWMGAVIELDRAGIREVQQEYVRAAVRSRDAGFDIINVWGGEVASLPVLFLMRLHNQRTDEYGGSLENRARFWLETLEVVREAVGDTCAVAARFCIDSLHNNDLGIRVDEEGIGFIEMADDLVDFWDVQVGGETAHLWIKDAGPSRFYDENFQAPWVRRIRPHTKKPIIGVGRFTNPDTMVAAIRGGQLDAIGAARPTISDPFLPNKIRDGRLDEIRECIGCNVCVSRVNAGWHLVCTQNATAGEEYRRGWHPEKFSRAANADKDVLVVGAGPAGMECAMVLGKRQMNRVHLVDAGPQLGGHLHWVSGLRGMSAWRRVIDYRTIGLGKLRNVDVILGQRLSAEAVIEYGAEIVVIATGARWGGDGTNGWTHRPIPGADPSQPNILTPEQLVVSAKPVPGERVVVLDIEGYFMGVSLAERLARDGKQVTLVTPFGEPAPYMSFTGEQVHMIPMLTELGVSIETDRLVTALDGSTVHGAASHHLDQVCQWTADAIVLATHRLADMSLYEDVTADPDRLAEAGVEAVYRIGDCVAPRPQVADAIFDGQRLAREIDSDDPAVPRRYIRERRVIGFGDTDYDAISARADEPYSSRSHVS